MAIFKCKMCGGQLEINDNQKVCICDYCGTKQTIPSVSDEIVVNLFNRANNLRMKNEFDKAQEIYEKIVSQNGNESEAYWGIVLCKFGIEYVENPATFKKIPTCHRTQFESVLTDVDYLAAIKHADMSQKIIYESEAKAIDSLQHDILETVHKEKPFDVFICYKETDESGKRTQDSVIANDIYHQLVQEGFKVFYSAITLEDKLGQEYEPYIFAALNSAKVMLAIGTKPEYFNAVWVKNEWSRFMKIMKNDHSRLLIPCYKDMDAYDLPEEFSHLQAQDMSKIGFVNDIVRGIKKVITKDEPKTVVTEKVINTVTEPANSANTAPLLERAFMFLEDGEWNKADEFCEKVLNIEPKNAQAYLGKLMAELKVKKRQQLKDCAEPFSNRNNYDKILRFGNEELKIELQGYINSINERNENVRLTKIYNNAISIMNSANSKMAYKTAADSFSTIPGFQNSDALAKQCLEKAEILRKNEIYDSAKSWMICENTADYENAIMLFKTIPGWKDADILMKQCIEKAKISRKNDIYFSAKSSMASETVEGYENAIKLLEKISGWKDADEQICICRMEIQVINAKEVARKDAIYHYGRFQMNGLNLVNFQNAIKEFKRIPGWRDTEEQILICKKKIEEINAKEEADRLEKEEADRLEKEEAARLEKERKAEERRIADEKERKKRQKMNRITLIIGLLIVALAYLFMLGPVFFPHFFNFI